MLTIGLKNGEKITANGSVGSLEELVNQINNQAILSITVGTVPINKNAISYIEQKHPEGVNPKVEIYLMNGTTINSYDDKFNATDYSSKINNQLNLFALLGDVIVNKFDYMMAIENAVA